MEDVKEKIKEQPKVQEKETPKECTKKLGVVSFRAYDNKENCQDDIRLRNLVFKHCTPLESVHGNNLAYSRMSRFICYSELFRELKEAEMIPEYTISFKTNDDGETVLDSVNEFKIGGFSDN